MLTHLPRTANLLIYQGNNNILIMLLTLQTARIILAAYQKHAASMQKERKKKMDSQAAWQAKQEERKSKAQELQARHPYLVPNNGSDNARVVAAKNMRIELKRAFPTVKFSVRGDSFSMGDSIDVRWTDGPTSKQVEAIIDKYSAGSFDGMTDYYNYSSSTWTDAFGDAKYVHAKRDYSDLLVAKAIQAVAKEFHSESKPSVEDYRQGRTWDTTPLGNAKGEMHWSWQSLIGRKMEELSTVSKIEKNEPKVIKLSSAQRTLAKMGL